MYLSIMPLIVHVDDWHAHVRFQSNRPRTYPPKFGKRVAHLHPRFCTKRELWFGTPLDYEDDTLGIQLFASIPWSETDWWQDADMVPVFEYLRGSKDLRLGSLRDLFPTTIDP